MELALRPEDLVIVDDCSNLWFGFESLKAEIDEEVDELLADLELDEE